VLPIGVTPVTAIPTRISHGPVAEAGIEFAEAQPQIIPLSELPEFATEQKNPGNKKHVTRIFVKLPSDRLAEGVTFVDTPKLGSLAVAGAEETIAYLPRCDLGIVLIDASAGLTPDDLIVVQALYQAGASAMVLISKADLFSAPDREQMIAYVKANLRSELRVEPSVHAVSVFDAHAALCDRWFEGELRPFLAQHHELAIASQKRKIGALREAVIGALERRLQVGSEAAPEKSATLPEKATEALRNGDRILERAINVFRDTYEPYRRTRSCHSPFNRTNAQRSGRGDSGRCISFQTGASGRVTQTGWDANDGRERNSPKNYSRKTARAVTAGQERGQMACSAKAGDRIRSRIAGVPEPLRKSPASLDGAKHQCAAQRVHWIR
jgi:hypothetical protein